MGPKRLGMIRNLVFTCHHRTLEPVYRAALSNIEELLDLTIVLKMLRKQPYVQLSINASNIAEKRQEVISTAFGNLAPYIEDLFVVRCLRKLGKNDILEFAEWIHVHLLRARSE